MHKLFQYLLICLLILAPCQNTRAEDLKVIGWAEKVRITPGNVIFNAKIDTGAKNSSINAKKITEFERDGQLWVRFDVVNRNLKRKTIELPQYREAKIKRHFGKRQRRPVVLLGICLGNFYKETQVSLVDREGFIYEMLIGRSFLKKKFLVNPSRQYTFPPECKKS